LRFLLGQVIVAKTRGAEAASSCDSIYALAWNYTEQIAALLPDSCARAMLTKKSIIGIVPVFSV
jgi:hypothetical protein